MSGTVCACGLRRVDGKCPARCEDFKAPRRNSVGVRANDLGPGKVLSVKDMRTAMRAKFPGDSAKWKARTGPVRWGAK